MATALSGHVVDESCPRKAVGMAPGDGYSTTNLLEVESGLISRCNGRASRRKPDVFLAYVSRRAYASTLANISPLARQANDRCDHARTK